MGYQPYASAPGMEPPEAQTIRSLLHIARIIAIIFGIIWFLIGVGVLAAVALVGAFFFAVVPILFIIWGVVDVIIYLQLKEIEAMVNRRQYVEAKAKSLFWMILGFILGGIIVGILVLIAYLKFDPLINWQRSGGGMGGAPPAYGMPPVAAAPAVPAAAPVQPPQAAPVAAPAPPVAPAPPNCANCGQPTTYIAQYGRYYCYACSRYV
jgi:hypothetical protein